MSLALAPDPSSASLTLNPHLNSRLTPFLSTLIAMPKFSLKRRSPEVSDAGAVDGSTQLVAQVLPLLAAPVFFIRRIRLLVQTSHSDLPGQQRSIQQSGQPDQTPVDKDAEKREQARKWILSSKGNTAYSLELLAEMQTTAPKKTLDVELKILFYDQQR